MEPAGARQRLYSLEVASKERDIGILSCIVLGLIAGVLARLLVGGVGGIIVDIVVGMVGAVVGGYLAAALGIGDVSGINLTSIVIAMIGAIMVLVIVHAVARRRVAYRGWQGWAPARPAGLPARRGRSSERAISPLPVAAESLSAAEARAYLTSHGVPLIGGQQTKTKAALSFLKEELDAQAQSEAAPAAA